MALDASVALGELLLKGWTMTADSCPSCRVPLMQSPTDGTLCCVGCHETIEERHLAPTGQSVDDTGAMDERLGPYALSSDQSTEMMEEEVPKSIDVSNILAQKMLQGFTLLSQNCPECRTPLLQKGREGPLECVSCQQNFEKALPHPTKRTEQRSAEPLPKMMKSTPPDPISHDWRSSTEAALTTKISSLTAELDGTESREAASEIVSLMNHCLDALLKLKEFQQS